MSLIWLIVIIVVILALYHAFGSGWFGGSYGSSGTRRGYYQPWSPGPSLYSLLVFLIILVLVFFFVLPALGLKLG